MRSYQHRYHAGSFADLHKQVVLIAILQSLLKKPTPFRVVDAFAGEGFYDLNSNEASKNKEFLQSKELINSLPAENPIIREVLSLNADDNLFIGSAGIISDFLREQDKAIFIEDHPKAYLELEKNFKPSKRIKTYKEDAHAFLNGLVPFPEKRGLVFLDPSYEVKTEYEDIAELIGKLYIKFATGIYVIWYPILAQKTHHGKLVNKLLRINNNKIWQHEWMPYKDQIEQGMCGSGIIIINLPWNVDTEINQIFRKK